jgi:hypothetical protein
MKGYMINDKANRMVTKMIGKKITKESIHKVDRVMINLLLDGDAVEIPQKDPTGVQLFIQEYRNNGFNLMVMPENDIEVEIMQQGLREKRMSINFKGDK